ncbi:hypothetical protein D9M68_522640 [compost metagenome]
MLGVVQAAADQRLVGIAFEEGHQHLHADARDGDAAVAVAGPGRGHAQPAAGPVVGLAVAVPVELHLDAAVAVAVDLLALGAGHHGGLCSQHAGLGVCQRWAIGEVPGGGEEAVAVALVEVRVAGLPLTPALSPEGRGSRSEVADGFLQHLRLLALMENLSEQPEVVPLATWMLAQRQEMPAAQAGLVAVALGLAVVGSVPLQGPPTQVPAAFAVGEPAGIVVVLQIGLVAGLRRSMGRLHQQPRLLEVVVATGDAAGTGFQAHAEALDHRLVGHQAGVGDVGGGAVQAREGGLVVAEHQQMAALVVLEVVVQAFFLRQSAQEMQVALVVLGAVVAGGIGRGAELEAVGVGEDAVLLEDPGDDLRHREVLEDALVAALGQVGQAGDDVHPIARQAFAGFTLRGTEYLAVNTLSGNAEGQERGLVQQRFQIEAGVLADQFQLEAVGLVDDFATSEAQYLQVVLETVDGQAEMGLVGGGEHPMSSRGGKQPCLPGWSDAVRVALRKLAAAIVVDKKRATFCA